MSITCGVRPLLHEADSTDTGTCPQLIGSDASVRRGYGLHISAD